MKKIGPSAACFIRGLPICRRDVMLFFLLFFFSKCRDYHKAAAFLKPPFSQGGVWLGNGENVMRKPGVQSEVLNLFRGRAVASSAAYIFFMSHTRTVSCSRAIFSSQVIWPACHEGRWKTLRKNMQLKKKRKERNLPFSHWVQIEGHLVSIRQGRPRLTASSADGICVPSQSARAKAKHKKSMNLIISLWLSLHEWSLKWTRNETPQKGSIKKLQKTNEYITNHTCREVKEENAAPRGPNSAISIRRSS